MHIAIRLPVNSSQKEIKDGKNIAKHRKKLDSITNSTFPRIGKNEVPHDAPSTPLSDNTKIPLSLEFFD